MAAYDDDTEPMAAYDDEKPMAAYDKPMAAYVDVEPMVVSTDVKPMAAFTNDAKAPMDNFEMAMLSFSCSMKVMAQTGASEYKARMFHTTSMIMMC